MVHHSATFLTGRLIAEPTHDASLRHLEKFGQTAAGIE